MDHGQQPSELTLRRMPPGVPSRPCADVVETPFAAARPRGRQHCRSMAAFTLLELLLVLAIMVAAGAIAIPLAVGPLEGQRLRKAADQVRASFNRARVAAMRTGQVHFFRFQPGTNLYAVEALNDGEGFLEASADVLLKSGGMPSNIGGFSGGLVASDTEVGGASTDMLTGMQKPQEISENTMFVRVASLADLKSARILEQMQAIGEMTLSEPILFYPDGTSSTAELVLANQQEQFVVIRLRGLTGLAAVSDLLTPDEVPQ